MEKRKLEKLGIETSLLGFGCMRFPTLPDGKIDEAEAERMLDKAIASGVNYIDTAYPVSYTHLIDAKVNEISEFKRTHEPKDLLAQFEAMYR